MWLTVSGTSLQGRLMSLVPMDNIWYFVFISTSQGRSCDAQFTERPQQLSKVTWLERLSQGQPSPLSLVFGIKNGQKGKRLTLVYLHKCF